jgi:uncharacterized protein
MATFSRDDRQSMPTRWQELQDEGAQRAAPLYWRMTRSPPAGDAPALPEDAEALERLLAGRADALGLDALQALCVAMAIGPDEEPVPGWMAVALGHADLESAPPEALATALERFRADIARGAHEGSPTPLLHPLRRGRRDYRSWAQGFLLGVELSPAGWHDAADPDDVDELLFPIQVLADELHEDDKARYTPPAWRKLVLESEAGLDATLARIRDYWAIVRHPPQTVRHATPKAGRNDPCPCGSGRKHKHCCGR